MPKKADIDPIPGWGGFYSPNYTPVPDDLFDVVMPHLTDVELRVLLYIIRRTFGFKKATDDISFNQIVEGIVKHNGERLDYGAGVSKRGAQDAVARLEARGVIQVQRNRSGDGRLMTSTYSLRMAGTPMAVNAIGYSTEEHSPMKPGAKGLWQQQPQQETVVTRNREQEDLAYSQESANSDNSQELSAESDIAPGYSAWIAQFVMDYSRELGDLANSATNVDRALRIWRASGLGESEFVAALQQARNATRKAQGRSVTSKIILFFEQLTRMTGSGGISGGQ